MTFMTVTHLIFAYYENQYLLFIKRQKLQEINRVKKNILLYNINLIKIKNDKEYFLNIAKRKYGLSQKTEFYLND